MNRHDQDILELGLRAKVELWGENLGPDRAASAYMAVWRRWMRGRRSLG